MPNQELESRSQLTSLPEKTPNDLPVVLTAVMQAECVHVCVSRLAVVCKWSFRFFCIWTWNWAGILKCKAGLAEKAKPVESLSSEGALPATGSSEPPGGQRGAPGPELGAGHFTAPRHLPGRAGAPSPPWSCCRVRHSRYCGSDGGFCLHVPFHGGCGWVPVPTPLTLPVSIDQQHLGMR